MPKRSKTLPRWFPYLDLACAMVAGGLWYALPQLGAVPLLLALAPWIARLALVGRLTRRTAFDLPMLLFLLTAGAAVWAAYDARTAWAKFWVIVGGMLLFYALVNAEETGDMRGWLLGLFGAGVALYFLVTHDWDTYPAKIAALTRLGRSLQAPLPAFPGHRLHPNVAGGIMAMMVPFAAYVTSRAWRAVRSGSSSTKLRAFTILAVGVGSVALTGFGLLMTTSRSAWIALLGAVFLAFLWAVSGWLSRASEARRSRVFPSLLILLLILALAVGLGVGLIWRGGIAAALEFLPGANAAIGRAELLQNAAVLVRDYPIIGAGLGGFMMLYSTYALLLHVGHSVHSHNLLLNVAIEQGVLALLCLTWMWVLFGTAVWRRVLGSETDSRTGLLGAAALSLVVVLVHGLGDDVLYGSRGVLLLFVPLAFAVPFVPQRERRTEQWTKLVLPVGLMVVLGLAIVWRAPVLSLVYSNLGAVHQSRTELGVYAWPEYPLQDTVRREVELDWPVALFERALALDPRNATANRRLGMIELSLGEYEDALAHLEAAYAAEPWSVTARQLLGEALIANGQLEEGAALWATVHNEQNQLTLRAFWYEEIGEPERAEWIRQAAGSE